MFDKVDWNSPGVPLDIEKECNSTLLDVLNYHSYMTSSTTEAQNNGSHDVSLQLCKLNIEFLEDIYYVCNKFKLIHTSYFFYAII